AIEYIHAVLPGEFKFADSCIDGFKYFSCHYSWYARYGEKGKDVPTGAHPNNIRKDHRGRVNFDQQVPHSSKDIQQDLNGYALLAEAYTDFFELLWVVLKHYLPDDYDEISIYTEALPLDAASPAFPFAGLWLMSVPVLGVTVTTTKTFASLSP
ncbi:hypothetical protein B0H10DRAFT_2323531, partial [Mycena sp. CBHHK59/15]